MTAMVRRHDAQSALRARRTHPELRHADQRTTFGRNNDFSTLSCTHPPTLTPTEVLREAWHRIPAP